MKQRLRALGAWWLAWLVLGAAGAAWIARAELTQLHEAFDTDARIAHRLLTQQVVQYDAVLATLALLGTAVDGQRPEQRLGAVYPSILDVQRRERGAEWREAALAEAEARSRAQRRPALAQVDLPSGRYRLVVGAEPVSYALSIDLAATVPWRDWPMDLRTSPARLAIEGAGQQFVVQPGRIGDGGWRFGFRKLLVSDSQAFDAVAERQVGWTELPWWRMAASVERRSAARSGTNGRRGGRFLHWRGPSAPGRRKPSSAENSPHDHQSSSRRHRAGLRPLRRPCTAGRPHRKEHLA